MRRPAISSGVLMWMAMMCGICCCLIVLHDRRRSLLWGRRAVLIGDSTPTRRGQLQADAPEGGREARDGPKKIARDACNAVQPSRIIVRFQIRSLVPWSFSSCPVNLWSVLVKSAHVLFRGAVQACPALNLSGRVRLLNLGELIMVSMREMLEAGCHFGHQTRFWNPKMGQYIFGARNKIHIINLEKTVAKFEEACKFARQLSAQGGKILFVDAKRGGREIIAAEAQRCGSCWVDQRWPRRYAHQLQDGARHDQASQDMGAARRRLCCQPDEEGSPRLPAQR